MTTQKLVVEQWSYFKNTIQDIQEAQDNYNLALLGDSDALVELIAWARHNAICDAAYNDF